MKLSLVTKLLIIAVDFYSFIINKENSYIY